MSQSGEACRVWDACHDDCPRCGAATVACTRGDLVCLVLCVLRMAYAASIRIAYAASIRIAYALVDWRVWRMQQQPLVSTYTRVWHMPQQPRGFRPTDRQTDAQKHRQTCVVHSAGTCHHYGHVSRPTSGFRLQHPTLTLTLSELACRAPTQVERHRQLPRNAGQGHGESRRGAAKGPGQCGRVSSRAQRPELLKLKHRMGTCQSSVGPASMGSSDLHAL